MNHQDKVRLMTEEVLHALRHKPVNSTLLERWFLLEEAWQQVEGLPQPIQMGRGLRYVIERASLPIQPYDLLLGRFSEKVPDEEEERRFRKLWQDGRPWHNPITAGAGGHITLDWAAILSRGISGYIDLAKQRLAEERARGAEEKTLHLLEGMELTYEAYRLYIVRYGEAAEAAGHKETAAVCRHIADHPPETFHQALQLLRMVLTVYYIYAGAPVNCLTYGRLDDLLLPYYEADLAAGRITEDLAVSLIADFNAKANLPLGRGEHQMANAQYGGSTTGWERNPSFDSPTYVLIGGCSNRHDHRTNPLTRLFAESIHPGMKNPVYIYRWTKDRPDDVWDVIVDKLRQNASILVYNDETMILAMRRAGIEAANAVDYTIHACNWPDVPSYAVVDSIGGPIPRMIMDVLMDGDHLRREYASLDDLYCAVEANFRAMVQEHFAAYRRKYRLGEAAFSGRISSTDCFTAGVLENGRGIFDGGVKYPVIYVLLRNIATAADMMAALEEVVYQRKACTLMELAEALASNYEGYDRLLTLCRRAPKFGVDNDAADAHAVRLMTMLLDVLAQESINAQGEKDVICFNVTITDMNHIHEGANLGATPDGRLSGKPLSENLSPTVGVSESATAQLNSVAKLPFDRLHAGAFNLRLRRDFVSGEEGKARLKALMDAYFDDGGMQIQLSIADTAELRRAQCCPEEYSGLMVRITGYSAIFVDMSKNAQDEIIRREEIGE